MKNLFAILVVVVVIGLTSGCGVDTAQIVGPQHSGGAPAVLGSSQTSGQIGSSGGSLSTGGVTLSVPARALQQTLTVTLSVTETDGDYFVTVEPEGQVLLAGATLTVPCESGDCGLLWWNPATEQWENLSVLNSPGYVQGRTIQFSRYETEDYQ
jgi:hypothetical protein